MISSPVIHDNTNLKRITAFCREVRLFLTDHWTAFHALNPETSQYRSTATRPTPSRSMCRFTSGFLLPRLLDRFPQERWKVRSGAATPGPDTAGRWRFSPAGLQDRDGVWHSHYWIEDHTGLIIDLTADQFGWSPVTVTRDPSVARRHRHNLARWALATHMKGVQWRIQHHWEPAWQSRLPGDPSHQGVVG